MKSIVTDEFIACFSALPNEVKERARAAYRRWRLNPQHPSLRFKPIRGHDNLYSVRVSVNWRAVGCLDGDTVTWFWIGSHAEYDTLIG